jgi:CBS domain-containing protein
VKVENVLTAKSPRVVCIAPSRLVREAVAELAANQVGALVVVDAATFPVGILSERDIVRAMNRHDDVLALAVSQLMTSVIVSGTSADDVDTLLQRMTTARVRHLPIVDNGELVGLVTMSDLVKARLADARGEVDSLQALIIGS